MEIKEINIYPFRPMQFLTKVTYADGKTTKGVRVTVGENNKLELSYRSISDHDPMSPNSGVDLDTVDPTEAQQVKDAVLKAVAEHLNQ